MKINEILEQSSHPVFSFEFFPPKTPEGETKLFATIQELKALKPDYVSITYGAGGSTRTNTVRWADTIQNEIGLTAMTHLTGVAASSNEMQSVLDDLQSAGIENILALRGDRPRDWPDGKPMSKEFPYATHLIEYIRKNWDFSIGGAVYPETHPEAENPDSDLQYALEKERLGASFFVSQLFFDNKDYFNFVEKSRQLGITNPIIAGIMPVTNYAQLHRFTNMCGSKIPAELEGKIAEVQDDNAAVTALGIEHALKQCRELVAAGVPGIHFYTLNKSRATIEILTNLKKESQA